ncbi:MAG TPA: hypothetical protein VMS99_14495 [Acidimicrobiia bacterium]|nr:hypothetical protein [Acidimicrobiia bacterium]
MTVDQKVREAASETRSAFAGRPRPPITRLASRAAVRQFTAVAASVLLVFATIGVAAWMGSGDAAETADTPPVTSATTQPVTETTVNSVPPTTAPTSTLLGDVGLSDTSAVPEGWRNDFPEDGRFLLLDSGIALAAFPVPESENDWWMTIAQAPHIDGIHEFGPDDQGTALAGMPEVSLLVAFSDERSEIVVAGIAPADTSRIEIRFGDAKVTVDRVFQRAEVGRSVFVGSFPSELLASQNPPILVEMSATDADGQQITLPDIGYHGSSGNDEYAGPITSELFRIPPPLIADSITADSLPEVVSCQGGPGVENPPANRGGEITDGEVLASPETALQALLAGDLSDSWYPQGGYIEAALPDGTTAFAVPFNGDLNNGAVMLIEVEQTPNGWTATSWEGSGC